MRVLLMTQALVVIQIAKTNHADTQTFKQLGECSQKLKIFFIGRL